MGANSGWFDVKTKKEIVDNWLPRYTGTPIESFGEYFLLTNFGNYLEIFAERTGAEIMGRGRPMPNATADGISVINFGMGSANAATVMDLLSARMPKAVLLLGKCGGLKKKVGIGDLVLPIAAQAAQTLALDADTIGGTRFDRDRIRAGDRVFPAAISAGAMRDRDASCALFLFR